MSVFSKKPQAENTAPQVSRTSVFDIDYPLDRSQWLDVFSACAGRSIAVQEAFAQLVVKNRDWFVDFSAQTLSFGEDAYPVQFIGSESSISNSWMWGWKNINNFAPELVSLADEIKAWGERYGLEALTTDCFALDETFNGHTLAMVATGISKKEYCYYRGPHDNGAAVMAVSPSDPRVFAPVDMNAFVQWTLSAIQQFDLDHRIFTESFLLWNGTPFEREGEKLVAYFPQRLMIKLEKAGGIDRITDIKTL